MYLISSLGIILSLLMHITVSSIYYVTPKDDDSTGIIESHTLQYYLNDSLKYFTSNTQLQFLAGTHHFYNNLVVQNVTNFSLVGSHITIVYSQHANIVIKFANNITISNLILIKKYPVNLLLLTLVKCSNVFIQDSIFMCHSKDCRLIIADALKIVILRNVSSDHLVIWHNQSLSDCNITVSKYTGQSTENETFAIIIELHQHNYNIKILLSQVEVKLNKAISLTCTTCRGTNHIKLEKTTFIGMSRGNTIIYVQLRNCGKKLSNQLANIIHLDECHFTEIKSSGLIFQIYASQNDFFIKLFHCIIYKLCILQDTITWNFICTFTIRR